jgi:hypothetical protein
MEKSIALLMGAAGLTASSTQKRSDVEASASVPTSDFYQIGSAESGIVVRLEDGSSQYHSVYSLLGLVHEARVSFENMKLRHPRSGTLQDMNAQTVTATYQSTMVSLERWLVITSTMRTEAEAADLSAIQVPNRTLLEQAIDLYPGGHSMSDQLFNVQGLRSLIEKEYSERVGPMCLATVTCFQYLITQSCRSGTSNAPHGVQISQAAYTEHMDTFMKAGKALIWHTTNAKLHIVDVQAFTSVVSMFYFCITGEHTPV